MKINKTIIPKFSNYYKDFLLITPLLILPIKSNCLERSPEADSFIRDERIEEIYLNDSVNVSPELKIGNDTIYPAIVIDKSENILYSYNLDTELDTIYNVGLGKLNTPTKTGVRIITGIESYPYKDAPTGTKRKNNPDTYGSKLLTLDIVDEKSGKTSFNDQFIHGTNNPKSIGKNHSSGCIRMNNKDIEKLVDRVFVGQYVLIKE